MPWFVRRRADDFDPIVSVGGGDSLLARIAAIPRDLLPSKAARERLVIEAKSGGPLIDVYRGGGGYGADFRAENGVAYVIERPMKGRHDARWPAPEWQIWVDQGMEVTPCQLCGEPPAVFTLPDAYRYRDGSHVRLCYSCNSAHLGLFGYTPHAILDPCPICHQVGMQVDPALDFCVMCYRTGRAKPPRA